MINALLEKISRLVNNSGMGAQPEEIEADRMVNVSSLP
jgi:hypothetical protein